MNKFLLFISFYCFCFCFSIYGSEKLAPVVPGEYLIKTRVIKNNDTLKEDLKSNGFEIIRKIQDDLVLVKGESKTSIKFNIQKLNKMNNVVFSEPNYLYKAIGKKTIKDPKFPKLWGLRNTGNNSPKYNFEKGIVGADISALNAWKITKGDKRIKIAVIDTGVDYKHPDLKNNIWVNEKEKNGKAGVDDDGNGYIDDVHGYDFANKDGDPMDGNDHGTHCAGTIAAEHNSIGVAGVMAHAQIVVVKFLTDDGTGSAAGAIEAINYATKIGVDIMSNSWGGGGFSIALKQAIEKARDAGIVFTAAAGNSNDNTDNTPHYPSNYQVENVISVAAHTIDDQLASFSSYGGKTVHIAAPGHNILSTTSGGKYDTFSGTSMATPHVSGVIGLYLAKHSLPTFLELKRDLLATSVFSPAYDKTTIGGGRVNAEYFLKKLKQPRPSKPDPNKWQKIKVTTFESRHPYANNINYSKTFKLTGAKFIRVLVKEFETEENYDYLKIKDKTGIVIQKVQGKGNNFVSDFVRGDEVTLEFTSDHSVNLWGFQVEELEFIK